MDPIPSIHGREEQQIQSQELRATDAGTGAGSYAEYLRQEQTPPVLLPDGARCADCERLVTCAYTSPRNRWCIITPSQFKRRAIVARAVSTAVAVLALVLPTVGSGQDRHTAKPLSSTGGVSTHAALPPRLSPAVPRLIPPPPVLRSSRLLWVRATFYCPCRRCCGEHACGLTATGRAAVGSIVAVDPRRIPLGSMVHVPGFGWMLAADTGRDIKGSRLDVLRPSHAEAKRLGTRWLCVEVTTWGDYQRRLEAALFQLRFDELVRQSRRMLTANPQPLLSPAGALALRSPIPTTAGQPPVR